MLALEPVVFMLNHNKVNKSEVKWSLSGHRHSQVDRRASRRELPSTLMQAEPLNCRALKERRNALKHSELFI